MNAARREPKRTQCILARCRERNNRGRNAHHDQQCNKLLHEVTYPASWPPRLAVPQFGRFRSKFSTARLVLSMKPTNAMLRQSQFACGNVAKLKSFNRTVIPCHDSVTFLVPCRKPNAARYHAYHSIQTFRASFKLRDNLRLLHRRNNCSRKVGVSPRATNRSLLALPEVRLLF